MQIHLEEKKSNWAEARDFILEVVRIVVISVAIIIPVRYYLIQPFYVKGASMEPNFYDHEYLLIDEISYRLRPPIRGEIVVFKFPLNRQEYFIKRIIGLPGETVVIKQDGIYIYNKEYPDGWRLDEAQYINAETKTIPNDAGSTITLKDNEYFVLGDNRTKSLDSRKFGSVNEDLLVGRAIIRGFPFNRLDTFFESPNYLNNVQEKN